MATPLSPFSTSGSQFIAMAPSELGDSMVKRQFVLAMGKMALSALFCLLGFCNILWI